MPIYEYACGTCRKSFEVKQRFSDEPVAVCPDCGSGVQRVLYPAGVIFKGSGWYITDSRSPSRNGSAGSSGSDSSSTSSDAKAEPAAAAADD